MHFATAPFFDDNLVDVLLTPYISVIMKTFKKIGYYSGMKNRIIKALCKT